jgi:superfamily II DNA/RNA helicase
MALDFEGSGCEEAQELGSTERHGPTSEQQACLDAFSTGENMVIEAGAGSGKTIRSTASQPS